ncbi:unnamed protein product [Paramecium sonneborni]|uniref:Kazal-like domain-containing protein n=1 Tax=Paramecium sonneborni TaxID=65129 RepID=A0A8S1NME6_9CILI|nr:unnamed protein product [Paramecium sonneborni]
MNYLIVATIILLTGADKTMCPLEIDTSVSCTKEHKPVCGYSAEGLQIGTLFNACFACRAEKVRYYENDACKVQSSETTTNTSSETSSQTTSNSNTIYKCNIPKSDNPICPAIFKPVCGLFISSIQCFKQPCGRTLGNECEACSDKNIDSYFYGECEEIPKEDPQNPPDDSITYCTEPRPDICTLEYIETCAFLSTPCFSDSCMKSVGNQCDACSNKDVVGYVKQSCAKYQQTYTQDETNINQKDPKSNSQNDEQDLDQNNNTLQQQCSVLKPSACDDVVKEVCATYKCNDSTCQKEYQNECQACLDSTTISYSQGKCQTLSGTILSIMSLTLFIQLII